MKIEKIDTLSIMLMSELEGKRPVSKECLNNLKKTAHDMQKQVLKDATGFMDLGVVYSEVGNYQSQRVMNSLAIDELQKVNLLLLQIERLEAQNG